MGVILHFPLERAQARDVSARPWLLPGSIVILPVVRIERAMDQSVRNGPTALMPRSNDGGRRSGRLRSELHPPH